MKPKITARLFASILALLTGLTMPVAVAQLRPEAEAARLVSRARDSMKAEKWAEARESFEKILAIDIELPLTFHYQYALTLRKTGAFDKSLERLSHYLNDDKAQTDEFYSDALALYNDAEATLARQKAAEEKARLQAAERARQLAAAEEAARLEAKRKEEAARLEAKRKEEAARLEAKRKEEQGKLAKERERAERVRQLKASADKGDLQAQMQLADYYMVGSKGLGIAQDYGKAEELYKNIWSYSNPAYSSSPHVKPNPVMARIAAHKVGLMYAEGKIHYKKEVDTSRYVFDRPTDEELQIKAAWYWFERAADLGYAKAQYFVGAIYAEGLGAALSRNYAKAMEYFQLAVAQKHAESMVRIGYLYADGKGVEKNPIIALSWYRKAAEAGAVGGFMNLGDCYRYGECGLQQDKKQALFWFQKAAEKGNSNAKEYIEEIQAGR